MSEPTVGDLIDIVQRHGVIHAYGYRIEFIREFTPEEWNPPGCPWNDKKTPDA